MTTPRYTVTSYVRVPDGDRDGCQLRSVVQKIVAATCPSGSMFDTGPSLTVYEVNEAASDVCQAAFHVVIQATSDLRPGAGQARRRNGPGEDPLDDLAGVSRGLLDGREKAAPFRELLRILDR